MPASLTTGGATEWLSEKCLDKGVFVGVTLSVDAVCAM